MIDSASTAVNIIVNLLETMLFVLFALTGNQRILDLIISGTKNLTRSGYLPDWIFVYVKPRSRVG